MARRLRSTAGVVVLAVLVLLLGGTAAAAHDERDPVMPDGSGTVPTYRAAGPALLVCTGDAAAFQARIAGYPAGLRATNLALWQQCQRSGYRYLQDAVDHVSAPGMTIRMLPGTYREEPSRAGPSGACAHLSARRAALGYQVLSWEQQNQCPHNQNLVAVFGRRDLQIEGTGAAPTDVVLDAGFTKLNALRVDHSNGIYLRNFTAQHTTFNAIYIMETDGFVIDHAIGRWNDEYGFLTFADDHGLYTGCEAYGNGDSGVYPGAAHNVNEGKGFSVERYAIEVRGCYSHDNLLGYSGTAGDSVWAHDNRFVHNGAGVSTDSAFPHHPGLPQNHAKFERNEIGDNNSDYFRYVRDGTCAKPPAQRGYESGVVCPAVGIPTGTGILNPGGNWNIWRDNWIYGNSYAGYLLAWVPGFVREDTRLGAQFDTSHHNRFVGNHLGVTPTGASRPNGRDAWWDGQGRDNCWQAPSAAGTEPAVQPRCGRDGQPTGPDPGRLMAEPAKVVTLYLCNGYSLADGRIPGNCVWFGARGLGRIEVQIALAEAVLLVLAAGLLWWRRLRGSTPATLGLAAGVAGAVTGVFGTAYEGTRYTALGLALLAVWWAVTGVALRRRGRPGLGGLTLVLALVAALGAVDRGLVMVPYLGVAPTWYRIVLEAVWLPWALVSALRRPRVPSSPAPAGATEAVAAA